MVAAYLIRRRLASAALGLGTIVAVGCRDGTPTGVGGGSDVPLRVTVAVVGTPVATLVVQVTAPDIVTPPVFNLTVAGGVASGTIRITPGLSRTITVTAMDAEGDTTHQGSVTLDVRPGQNLPVVVRCVPRAGQVPITVTFGNYGVVVTPPAATVDVGAQVQLAVAVTDADGHAVASPAVSWATSQPATATVSASGLVSGISAGTATIVATYEGVAALSTVTVTGVPLTVAIAGTGAGTVVSSPARISCSATCTATFDAGTSVVLTATAAGGSVFEGWSGGGCAGAGTCTTTVSAAATVTATFNAIVTLGHAVQFTASSSNAQDFLLGEQIVVPSAVTLRQFGVWAVSSGPQVQMALYTSAGGAPGSLVAQTAATTMVTGTMQMNATAGPVTLPAGTYWIMAVFNSVASVGYSTADASNVVAYRSLPFGTTLPATFGPATTYTGQSFNYFLVVD